MIVIKKITPRARPSIVWEVTRNHTVTSGKLTTSVAVAKSNVHESTIRRVRVTRKL